MSKRKFLAVAVMPGHGKILEKGYIVPSDPQLMLRSMLNMILGLAGGTAILKVVKHDSTRDGSQACADLIEWYEGR
jgi:hypothetical protein